MKKTRICRRLWVVVALLALSAAAGISFCQIRPSGRKAGLIQFDVLSEVNLDGTRSGNMVVFSRYWVCEEYYVVSVVWTEPHGGGVTMKTVVVLSDETGFRMDNELFSDHARTNTTYPKPLGERPPFRWAGGFYGGEQMRFAEAQALARRVYVSDLGPPETLKSGANRVVDVDVPADPGGAARKLARLKVQAKDDRIESMELFDDQHRSLARIRYEFERQVSPPRITTLVAELPIRPEKLATGTTTTLFSSGGKQWTHNIPDVDYVSHKGGRTCTVTYRDVQVGDTVLRLPVQVRVQRSDNGQLVRSARLMNFRRADLDKDEVWKAAREFGGLDSEYSTWRRLVNKYLHHTPNLGPLRIDPNDFTVVRRLIARYPVWESPAPPKKPAETRVDRGTPDRSAEEVMQQMRLESEARRQEQIQWQEQMRRWREEVARMPRPQEMEIDPNDTRMIRQLIAHYDRTLWLLLEHQRTELQGKGEWDGRYDMPASERAAQEVRDRLYRILRYHRHAPLPEDRPPEPDYHDLRLIRQLKGHYEKLVQQQDRGLGGRLRALHALTRLDLVVKDYDAFEGRAGRYLQMLRDAGLNEMYMAGGYRHIESLVQAGQYEKANKLFAQWADRSAAVNDVDGVYRFCGSDVGGRGSPWAAIQLLDRFLKRPGLSPVQRYEGLALRAIALDKIDKWLADPDAGDDESRAAQMQWILGTTTRAQIARMVEPAIRQAVSAWEALGPARWSEARPYSTAAMPAQTQNIMEAPDATRLQETSAQLDQVVRQRTAQQGAAPRPAEARRPETRRR
jgi:hypothetical protein